ncbi:MAG: hypothetical protein EOP39_11930 [Rubrivivax sp.]|nr:MAG: hypothetical protein EOP39_11930 [Rubrivivax sp.]
MAGTAALCACSRSESPPPTPAEVRAPIAAASDSEGASPWVGRWNGPEGTFVDIAGGPGTYRVTVQNLDGPRSFDAKAGIGSLVFQRDGVTEALRAGNGVDTGMKWLANKRDCLVVKVGEGYCRD